MSRTSESAVRGLITVAEAFDVKSPMRTAEVLVDTYLSDKGLSEDLLELIELYLSCHFAALSQTEGPLAANSMGEATERYHNIYASGLRATRFGQQAIVFDTTGTLSNMAATAENPSRRTALFSTI